MWDSFLGGGGCGGGLYLYLYFNSCLYLFLYYWEDICIRRCWWRMVRPPFLFWCCICTLVCICIFVLWRMTTCVWGWGGSGEGWWDHGAIVPFFVFVFGFVFVSVFLLCLYLYLYYDDLCMGMRRWWWRMVRPSCRHRLRLWPVAHVAATGRRTPGKATPPASAPATKLPETELEVGQENGRIAAVARNKKSIGGQPNRVIQVGWHHL